MKRQCLYTPAWRSPNDPDRKATSVNKGPCNELAGSEAGTLLPRRDGKVVPVCVHIEDNGLFTDDDEEDDGSGEEERLTSERLDSEDCREDRGLTPMAEFDCVDRRDHHAPCNSVTPPSPSSSSVSGDLRAYNDSNLPTSVYDLPAELDQQGAARPPRPRSESTTAELPRQSRVETLASDAVAAVIGSLGRSLRDDHADRTVSSPAVFVVSDTKQLVIFTVDRTPHHCSSNTSVAPAVAPLSHSDQTLNR